ncbi:secreted protein [Melampsora americana]|nr:secreted protein [Melampsora americana]
MCKIYHHLFIFPFVCAFAVLLLNSSHAANLEQSRAFGISNVCNGSIACSLVNGNWPTEKDFSCGNESISSTSFRSAYSYIMMGEGTPMLNSTTSWPSSVTSECQNSTAANRYRYDNGVWNAYYSIVANCGCEGTGETALPNCTAATSQSSEACNVAMFTFCAIEMNDVVCTYT